jgi:hypothetical protein
MRGKSIEIVTLLIYNQNIIKKHEALPKISLQPIFTYRKAISKAKNQAQRCA